MKHVLAFLALFVELSLGIAKELKGDSTIRDLASNQGRSYFEFTQLGGDVEGRDNYPNDPDSDPQYYGDRFGFTTAMNSNGSRVAVGAPGDGYCADYDAYVDVFELEFTDDGSPQWALLGNSIKSSMGGRGSQQIYWGINIGMNGAGTRVVIGNAGDFYGVNPSMRVVDLDETTDPPTWKLVGKRVPEVDDCNYYCDGGAVVAISKEGGHVAFQGDVYAHNEVADTWEEVGTGLENCDVTGFSADGKRVNCGVSVYQLDETSDQWNQVGSDVIDGRGFSELNENGNTLAVTNLDHNKVQVYQLDDDLNWKQVGNDITAEDTPPQSTDWYFNKVGISADGNRVAIEMNNQNPRPYGEQSKVDIFDFKANTKKEWKKIGSSLKEESPGDLGYQLSLSSNGLRLAIGAPQNNGNGLNTGHFRAYEMQTHTVSQIKSSYDYDGTGKTWCMQPLTMSSGALVKAKPCKDNEKKQRWFHDTDNQIRIRLKPWLCAKAQGNRAVQLGFCKSSGTKPNMVKFFYDEDEKQIYVKKKKNVVFNLGIDLTTKNIRIYGSQATNPSLSLWSIDPV